MRAPATGDMSKNENPRLADVISIRVRRIRYGFDSTAVVPGATKPHGAITLVTGMSKNVNAKTRNKHELMATNKRVL
jgi:hypothetical protein